MTRATGMILKAQMTTTFLAFLPNPIPNALAIAKPSTVQTRNNTSAPPPIEASCGWEQL